MSQKNRLLDQLKLLNDTQFNEIVFRLDEYIDKSYLSPSCRASRAMDLIDQLELKDSLYILQEKLDELKCFEVILPEGAYLVNKKLLEFEENKEREKLDLAKGRGEGTETLKITPEKFYTFRDEAKWIGIFRNWDSKRKFYPKLYRKALESVDGGTKYPVAAVIGSGGSGKSVVLRRLAVDLANKGFKVWWVDDPERFVRYGMHKLSSAGDELHIVFFDEVQWIDKYTINQYVINQLTLKKRGFSLISIVAGRSLPHDLKFGVKFGDTTIFSSDETSDLSSILDKIAETIPNWANLAIQLKSESLQKARLIQILVVLAKQKVAPQNLKELEEHFLKIIADDITEIKNILLGLDEAIVEAAALCELGCYISFETFISIADFHNPRANIPDYLEDFNNERWKFVEYLLSYNPEFKTVKFHHEELAKGVLLAAKTGLLGECMRIDDTWKRVLLKSILKKGSNYSKSYALRAFALNNIIDEEEVLKYINQLLTDGIGHHAYLRLILNEDFNFSLEERINLLKLAVTVAPYNNFLWGPVWTWIKNNNKLNKESRLRILNELYQAGCQSYDILNNLLDNLPEKEALILAGKFIEDQNISKNVLIHCFYLKGKDGIADFEKWLEKNPDDSNIRVSLLKAVEKNGSSEQKSKIIQDTQKWLEENPGNSFTKECLLVFVGNNGSNEQKNKIIQDTQKWLEENPDESSTRVALLTIVEKNGSNEQKNKIIQDTQKWLEKNPDDSNIRVSLLKAVEKNGFSEQKSKIIQDTQKWLEENPDESSTRVALLTIVEKNGSNEQKNKIIQDTQKWLEENSYKTNVFEKLFSLLIDENRSEQAINIAKKAFEFNSENPVYLESYLRLTQDVMTVDEFKTYFELLFKMLPKDLERRLHFANLLRDKGYYAEAGNLYFYLIEKDPKNFKYYYGYGCLLLILKNYEKAAKNFKKVLTFRNRHAAAHNCLGFALTQLEKFEEAERELNEAIYCAEVSGSKTGKFHHDLGILYLEKLNRLEEAEKEFRISIEENPDSFANYWHLGKVYYLQKRYILAKDNLLKAIEKAPLELGPPASEEIDILLKECEKKIIR